MVKYDFMCQLLNFPLSLHCVTHFKNFNYVRQYHVTLGKTVTDSAGYRDRHVSVLELGKTQKKRKITGDIARYRRMTLAFPALKILMMMQKEFVIGGVIQDFFRVGKVLQVEITVTIDKNHGYKKIF